MSGYIVYVNHLRAHDASFARLAVPEQGKKGGQMWRNLSDAEQKRWKEQALAKYGSGKPKSNKTAKKVAVAEAPKVAAASAKKPKKAASKKKAKKTAATATSASKKKKPASKKGAKKTKA